ncbi:lamin tail domain-containing protein [Luteolibacter arcticus]|uniref:Lamin tail domain-containing protein n=1 Tax=Luteolibacter arcticus TaxID=1581411 RepID=A0ABT3GMZ1_9BACT|nr:lamin tail domain-containing protein [Luteolibacter arcticus]MCW1924873.1 lamin tail domain-containing protein [Luteolibacter arcticus]
MNRLLLSAVRRGLILSLLLTLVGGLHGATLGNTTEGTSSEAIWNGSPFIHANRVQATSAITVDRLFAKVKAVPGAYKAAIYTDDSGIPNALLRETAEVAEPAEGWRAFTLAQPVTLAAGTYYWFAIWSDSAEAGVFASEGAGLRWGQYAYGAWPDPVVLDSGPAAKTFCLYAQSRTAVDEVIAVRGSQVEIPDGDTTPRAADDTDFGTVDVTGATRAKTFTIYNPGTTLLTLNGTPKVAVTGPQASDFTVTAVPGDNTLTANGDSTTFTVTFNPSAAGLRRATLTIANSASSGAFDFVIEGTGAILDFIPQSIFPPGKTGNNSGAEGNHYELGTVFRSDLAGAVTHLRVYAVAGETGDHSARLWRNSDGGGVGAVIGGPYTWNFGGATGWITLDIPDVALAADTDYTVVVSTGSGGRNYAFVNGDLQNPGGNAINLSYPAAAGVFSTSPGARPTQSFQSSNYLRDVVFVAGGGAPPTTGPVRITEFVASNESGLQDEDGDFSDWIELYNPTATPVNLAGYKLVDSAASWTFPSVTLGAQQFLVVYASEKNRVAQPGNLHTGFKLDSSGEYLALKNAAGTVIAEFGPAYPPQRADISHGRRSNGDAVFFLTPSPGAANGFSFLGFVGDTNFSVKRGFFNTPQTVAISTITPGAQIRYTLDGSTPTETTGTLYSGPLTLSATTTLRARAFLADYLPTNVDTNTYVFLGDVLQQSPATAQAYGWPAGPVNGQEFRHGLKSGLVSQYDNAQMLAALQQIPTMSVVTDQAHLTNPSTGIYVNPGGDGLTWERPVSLELIHPDGTTGFQENCGLRIRGGQSRSTSFPKHSFHVNFRRDYGAGKLDYRLFGNDGANEFDTFDLRCEHGYAYADPQGTTYGTEFTAVRDVFCRDLSGASGRATTRSDYYHLLLNGQYWGLYQTQERSQDDYGETYLGGTKEEYDVIKATGLPQLTIENSAGNYEAWTALWNGCRAVAANPTNANYFALLGRNGTGTPNPALPVLLDPRALASYMLLHYYCGHSDEPLSVSFNFERPNNFRALRRQGIADPFHFFVHDGESSMMAPEWVNNRANAVNLTSPNRATFSNSNPEWMHEDLLASPEYRIAFADEAQRLLFNDGTFTAAKAQALWDARAAQIDQAVIGESIRWGNAANHNQATWAAKIAQVRSQFFATRSATVVTQLRQRNLFPAVDAPVFSQRGGVVAPGFTLTLSSLPGQTGTIYYTTDGTDPRAIGGSLDGTAYSAPININAPVTVKARFRGTGNVWSALETGTFTQHPPAGPGDLVISEFNYNAPGPTVSESNQGFTSGNQFEWIELMNIADSPRDLTGVRLTTAITFDFTTAPAAARVLAPGQRVVVVSNLAAFNARLAPGATPLVAGTYSSNLDNGGETIVLRDASNNIIQSFAYSDELPWPLETDGNGRTLVLNHPGSNPDQSAPRSWRPSATLHGSPGTSGSPPLPVDPSGDDDGDGLSNLLEYACGPNPKPTLVNETYIPPSAVAAEYGFFRFPRSLAVDGIDFTAETSTTLTGWTTTELDYVSTTVTTGGQAIVTYRTKLPAAQLGERFFVRLRVTP